MPPFSTLIYYHQEFPVSVCISLQYTLRLAAPALTLYKRRGISPLPLTRVGRDGACRSVIVVTHYLASITPAFASRRVYSDCASEDNPMLKAYI